MEQRLTPSRRAAGRHPPAFLQSPNCQGTPLRNEIEARDASGLGEAADITAEAIARRLGQGAIDGKIEAQIFTVQNSGM